ncbi:MAG TPA: PAS domain S-box protein, partial [Anaerolineales bacterium]|nr:PAS domain S-box protein [Anaerolineales bacterium]
ERGEPVRMVGTVQDVTERVEVDWKLRAQDEMLRNVVSSAPIVLWAVDRKGRVTFAERGGLAALGVRGGATIGANIFEQTQISPQICEYVRRALKGQDSEIDIKQGDQFFDARFSAVRNERGDVIGASGIALDITERIDAEEALRASDRRFRQVIEGVKDYAIFTLSPEGLITSWNPGAERTTGYLAEEVLGRHFSIFYPEEAQEKDLPSIFLRRAKEEGRFEEEGWRTGKDERRFWAEVLITAIYDENGELTGYSKIVRDISARREAEQTLRSSEARFRSIFESSAMGIALINLDGRFLITNPVIEAIFDYTSAEFLNHTLGNLAFRKDAVTIQGLLSELATGKRDLFRSEGRFRRADGRIIWSNLTVSLVRDSEGRPHYAICMIEDITFRKRMEVELNEIKRQLIAARERERLHLAQELHDSPMQELYGVMFQIEALNGEIEDDETQDELELMRQGVEGVVDNLRAICGDLRPPALAPFGLEGALREHLDKFEADHPTLKLHTELTYDGQLLPEELRLILFRIYQQAMANIVRHAEADNVYIRFYYTDERVFLEIEDDGRGFEVPMRWVNFTRQNHLGLAGAAERAELAGGKMNVKSSPGQGTLIYVELPLHQETDPSLE